MALNSLAILAHTSCSFRVAYPSLICEPSTNLRERSMPSSSHVVATALVVLAFLAAARGALCEEQEAKQAQVEPTRTGKERLGGKASDEQRVDNCKVPPDLRGAKPRPDKCRGTWIPGPKR
jgi:hypothetical protein